MGCDIIRPAVPDMEAAKALREIKKQVRIPVIADIHFHYQLALESIAAAWTGFGSTPATSATGTRWRWWVRAAKERQIPIRIGVNFGSLPPVGQIGKFRGLHGTRTA